MEITHVVSIVLALSIHRKHFLCEAEPLPWNSKNLQYKVNNILPVFNLDTYLFRARSCDRMMMEVFRQGVNIYRVEMVGPNAATGAVTTVTLNDLTGALVGQDQLDSADAHIQCDSFKNFYVHWSQGVFLFGSGSIPHENVLSSLDLGNDGTEMYDYLDMTADRDDSAVSADVEWLPGFINGFSTIPGRDFSPEQEVALYDYNDTCIQFPVISFRSIVIDFGIPFYLLGTEINVILVVGDDTVCSGNDGDENIVSLYIGHDGAGGCDSKSLHQCSFTSQDSLMERRSCRFTCSCVDNTCTSGKIHVTRINSNLEICELLVASQTF